DQSETLWYLESHPLLVVALDDQVATGDELDVVVHGELRLPYMQIAPGEDGGPGTYVPNVVHQSERLVATVRDAPVPELARVTEPRPAPGEDPFPLGLTLYSASAEFRAGWFDFDQLLDRVADLGIGPGIEIVASQMLPEYPRVTDDF